MAVKTTWTVTHSCGHSQDHDLSDKRPSERAGFARWLAGKEGSACWRASRDKENNKDREVWLAERRAAEAAEIETWERQTSMPVLDGSEKQVQWARRVRRDLLTAAHDAWLDSGKNDDDFAEQVEAPARLILRAHWWIDQRDALPEDVPELVSDAAGTEGSENPW